MRSKPSRTQRGGQTDATESVAPPELPKAFFTSPTDVEADPFVMSGGKKVAKKPAAKKPAAKKPAAKAKKGGSLAEELKSLAVPFAILLAKQGLDGMFDSKKKGSKKAIEVSSSKRKAAVGGGCSSCAQPVAPKAGGSKSAGSSKSRYAQLAKEIDDFLSKY